MEDRPARYHRAGSCLFERVTSATPLRLPRQSLSESSPSEVPHTSCRIRYPSRTSHALLPAYHSALTPCQIPPLCSISLFLSAPSSTPPQNPCRPQMGPILSCTHPPSTSPEHISAETSNDVPPQPGRVKGEPSDDGRPAVWALPPQGGAGGAGLGEGEGGHVTLFAAARRGGAMYSSGGLGGGAAVRVNVSL